MDVVYQKETDHSRSAKMQICYIITTIKVHVRMRVNARVFSRMCTYQALKCFVILFLDYIKIYILVLFLYIPFMTLTLSKRTHHDMCKLCCKSQIRSKHLYAKCTPIKSMTADVLDKLVRFLH